MKTAVFFLLCLCFIAGLSYSQSKIRYGSQNYVGLLEGEYKAAFQLQTIHGLRYKTWYGGLGAGLDYYMFRTIPVFATINKDLVFKGRTFYISGDVGTNYPWINDNPHIMIFGEGSSKYSRGFYWAGGLGYKAFAKNKTDAFIINLGYSFKRINQKRETPGFCSDPPCSVNVEQFKYQLNRISAKVGWQF
jgi:hypothetical protein